MYLCRKPLTTEQKRIKEEKERVSVTIEQQLLDCLIWNKEHPNDRVEIKIKTPRSWIHPSIKYSKEFRKIQNILYDDPTLLPERTKIDKDTLNSIRQNHAGMLSLVDIWKLERQIHETKLYTLCEKLIFECLEWNGAHSSEQVEFSISTPFIWKHEHIEPTIGNVYRIVQDIQRRRKDEIVITEQELQERFQTRLKDLRFQDYLLQSEFGKDDSDDEKEGEVVTPMLQSEVCTRPYHIPCPVPLTKSHQMGATVTRYMAQNSRMMASSPDKFTFDWSGRFIVQKSDWRLQMEAKCMTKELAFRRKYMPADHSRMAILRQTGLPPEVINILFRTTVTPTEYVQTEHQRLFFSPLIMGDTRHQIKEPRPLLIAKHPRPIMAHCVIEEDTRRFNLAVYLGTTEILPTLKEESDLENFMTLPINNDSTGLDDEKIDYSMVDLYVYEGSSHLNVPGALNLSYELKLGRQCGHEEKLRSLRDLHEDLKMHSEGTGESTNSCNSHAIYRLMKHRKPLVIKGRRFSRKKHSRLRRQVVDQGLPPTEKCTMIQQLNMERDIALNQNDLYFPRKSSSSSSVLDQHGLIQPPTKCCIHGPCNGRECIEFKINEMALQMYVNSKTNSKQMIESATLSEVPEEITPHGHEQNEDKDHTVDTPDNNVKALEHTAIIIDSSQKEKSTVSKKWSSLKEKLKPALKLNQSGRIYTKGHKDDGFVEKTAEVLKSAISPRTKENKIPQSIEGQAHQYQDHGSPRCRQSYKEKKTCLSREKGMGDKATHTPSEREDDTNVHENNRDRYDEAQNNPEPNYHNVDQNGVLPVLKYGNSKHTNVSFDIGFEPVMNGKKKPVLSSDRRSKKTKEDEHFKDHTELHQDATMHADYSELPDPNRGKFAELTQTQRVYLVEVPEGNNSHNARQVDSEHKTTSASSQVHSKPHFSTKSRNYALEPACNENDLEMHHEYPKQSKQYSQDDMDADFQILDLDDDDDDNNQTRRNRTTEFTSNYPVPAEWLEDPYESSETESEDEIVYTEEQKKKYEEFETRIQILQASMDVEEEKERQFDCEYRPLFVIYEDEEDVNESGGDDAMGTKLTWDYQKLANPYLDALIKEQNDYSRDDYGDHGERDIEILNVDRAQSSHIATNNEGFGEEQHDFAAERNQIGKFSDLVDTQSETESQSTSFEMEQDVKSSYGSERKREHPSRIPVRCEANVWRAMRGKTNATPIQPVPGSRIPILVQNAYCIQNGSMNCTSVTSSQIDGSDIGNPIRHDGNAWSTLPGKSRTTPMKVTPDSKIPIEIQNSHRGKAVELPKEDLNEKIKKGKESRACIPIRRDENIWRQMQGKSEATPIKPIPGSRIPIRVTSSDHETGRANRTADSFTQSSRSASKIPARTIECAWRENENDPVMRIKRRNYYQEKKMAILRNNVVKHPVVNTNPSAGNELHIKRQQTRVECSKFVTVLQPSPPTKPKDCETPRFRRSRLSPTGIENGEIGTFLQPSPPCETPRFRRSRFSPTGIENSDIGTYLQPSSPSYPRDCESTCFRRSRFPPIENKSTLNRDHFDGRNILPRPPSYATRRNSTLSSCETDYILPGPPQSSDRAISPAPRSRFPPLRSNDRPRFVDISKQSNETRTNRKNTSHTFIDVEDLGVESHSVSENRGMSRRPSSASGHLKLPPITRRTGQSPVNRKN